ncbi:hypothetical protein CWI42_120660 [Ordospora colligata]|uniref:Uncharacterized protein n=1 Tax=Ordospora colligata OC4 TaxID=1354746 RepID=A0A0B2UCT8_9MICR|nr:uncharacterized protein M896_120660 [Ordospora colligata OC4]KHN68846.1 hypothetical protein M896_120660 [Ordospora colligata OC4]TBU13880.1 hypothetical protein CWI40_120660 [Ordospora colligata]TBU14069.1 hypothetical protein CWI41_120660 [Ordospora colligata]TBU17738.1 hypothetical protein CWI42_120660 [Ordospora colligata]
MSKQTETEAKVAEIVKKQIGNTGIKQELFERISIQTVVCDGGENVLVVKVPKVILQGVHMSYGNVVKAIKQQFHDYFIMFIRSFEAERENGEAIKQGYSERESNWIANACFPYLLTGVRTDVYSINESVTNILLEARTAFSKAEMDIIGVVLSELLKKRCVVDVNHHTKN